MNRSRWKWTLAVFGIGTSIVVVNIAIRWETPKPQELTIAVTGTRGRTIEARLNIDGNESFVNGAIPAEFTVIAHQLSWEVERLDGLEKELFGVAIHTSTQQNWGGFAEGSRIVRGGSVGPSGLRRKRAWLGRLHE